MRKPNKTASKAALFVEVYLANGRNATQAAIAAGYSPKGAHQTGHRLLRNADIAELLADATKRAVTKARLKTEDVLSELACIVHADPGNLVDGEGKALGLKKLDETTRRAIASVEFDEKGNLTKVRFWDKNAAITNAMRYLGLLYPEPLLVPPPQMSPPKRSGMTPMEAYQRMLAAPNTAGGTVQITNLRSASRKP